MIAALSKGRALKILLSICFLLIAVALLLIDRHSPATGYELSMYESLPVAVWICLIAALAMGTGVVVHQAFTGRKSKYWLLAFCVLLTVNSTILLLPVFRGYLMYSAADTVAHLGWTDEILRDRHTGQINRYPMQHILMAQLAHVSGAPVEPILQFIPVLFTFVFTFFSYLLASAVLPKKGQALLVAAAVALLFNYYHVSAYAQGLSVMLLPLVFYLYFKARGDTSVSPRAAFVIVLFLFTYSHPAPAAVLIICLAAAEAAKALWRARMRASLSPDSEALERVSLEPTLICTVAFLTWISSYALFKSTIYKLWGWLGGEIRSIPHVEVIEQMLTAEGLGIEQQVELGLKMYGDNLIFLSLSGIALAIVVWRFLRCQVEVKNVFTLSMPFLISGPAWVLIFTATVAVTVGRLLGSNIMMWATPVLASFALWELFWRWKRVGVIVVTSILFCASVVGVFGVYHSPYILQASWHVTRQDVNGSRWFAGHTDLRAPKQFASLGVSIGFGGVGRFSIPEHFGHPEERTLGSVLGPGANVLVAQRFRSGSAHPTLSKATVSPFSVFRSGFSTADFQRLERDPTVNRLYSNGELDVLRVRGGR